jgi:hypothetical protein
VWSFLGTAWFTLRHPSTSFALVKIDARGTRGLLWLFLLAASAIIVAPWTGVLVGDPSRNVHHLSPWLQWGAMAAAFVVQMAVVAAGLWMLTWIEVRGVRLFGRQRGWRVTPDVAWTVCAHAAVGWVLAGVLPIVLLLAWTFIRPYAEQMFAGRGFVAPWGGFISRGSLVSGGLLFIGYGLGLFAFEGLVYLGIRRCRFANREPAARAAATPS